MELSNAPMVRVGHVEVTTGDVATALSRIGAAAARNEPVSFKFVNAYSVALAESDEAYRRELENGINFPDGAPVAWMTGRLSRSVRPQRAVRGPEVFEEALLGGALAGRRHYFLGGTPAALKKLITRLKVDAPDVTVAGAWSPPFASPDEIFDESVRRVRDARADLIWIGLGTPKQDLLAARLAESVGVPCLGVGAAFDFLSGHVREAPAALRGSGLEWLYRLSRDPRRLWKRYAIGNFIFARAALRTWGAALKEGNR